MHKQTKREGQRLSPKRPQLDNDQPSKPSGRATATGNDTDEVPPRFDEGGRKPAPIERTSEDGVRGVEPGESATLGKGHKGERHHTEATMPPGEPQPKRNTM